MADIAGKMAAALSAALLAAILSGCALFRDKPVTEVNDSQLNWLTVRYHPAGEGRKPCYLNIIGVGSVEYKEGRSPLVFNPFSQDLENPLWGDIDQEKLGVTPEQARWMMQLFVDAGLTREGERMKKLPNAEKGKALEGIAMFSAKLNNESYRVATNNPELIETLEEIIKAITENRGFH